MSDEISFVEEPTQPKSAPPPPNPSGSNQSGGPRLNSFAELIGKLGTGVTMSSDGQDYLKKIRGYLEDSANSFRIISTRLSYPNEAYLFSDENRTTGIILIFKEAQEMLDNDNYIPSVIANTVNNCFNEYNKCNILNCILVTREDYKKDQAMGQHIRSAIMCAMLDEFAGLKLSNLGNQRFVIDGNIDRVNNFCRKVSPHEILPITQFGFNVGLTTNVNNMFTMSNKENFDVKTIAAVCGYTEFLQVSQNFFGQNQAVYQSGAVATKFIPVVNISEIITVVPATPLLNVLVWMALNVFIYGEMWKTPFANYGTNEGPNIGNLIVDPNTNVPFSVLNPQQREQFINMYCEPPSLVLNVTEGRARIPGIDKYADPTKQRDIAIQYSSFIGNTLSSTDIDNMRATTFTYSEFIGNAVIKGNIVDSRWVTFLNVLANDPGEHQTFQPLLHRNDNNPSARLPIIKTLTDNNYQTNHINYICVLDAEVLRVLGKTLMNQVKVVSDINNTASTVDINSMINQARNINQGGFHGFSSGSIHNLQNLNTMNSHYMNRSNFMHR